MPTDRITRRQFHISVEDVASTTVGPSPPNKKQMDWVANHSKAAMVTHQCITVLVKFFITNLIITMIKRCTDINANFVRG
jgi:hypothetical protein